MSNLRSKVRTTQAGYLPLCEVCLQPWDDNDVDEDGYSEPADCCERIGLCRHCRLPGNHDCDEGRPDAKPA